jgi:protein-S-isoprenylcysteine O-methyltransferase Ste14
MTKRPSRSGRPGGGGRGWFLAGYAGIAGFLALEALARKPGQAASLEASPDDQGTTRMIVAAYGVAAELPLVLRRVPALRVPALQLPPAAAPAGLVVQAAGLALRAWSMRTLGESYTRTLRTGAEQPVVTAGPYRLVRHPGYTGSLLTWTGFALTSRSVPVLALAGGLLGRAYQRRIDAEEQLLSRDLPGYAAYQERTKKLVPFVW